MLEQRKVTNAWNEGARALGFRRQGEPWLPEEPERARHAFLACVAQDPGMADAWLGLHALEHEPEVALDHMIRSITRLGEQRQASGRALVSHYQGGVYCRFPLETWEDLYLAQAARWLVHERPDVAWGYLSHCPTDRPERALLTARAHFAAGDYEAMLPIMQGLAQHRVIGPEANLWSGIALARRELFGEADRTLAAAAQVAQDEALAMEATYHRAMVLRRLGDAQGARQCLEWVYRHDPHFRQVAELLANPGFTGLKTEPLAPPEVWSGPRENVADLLAELEGQIGLERVKEQVRGVTAQVNARRLRAQRGLPVVGSSNHLVFAGPPGTGKTTVARLVGRLYAALEVLRGTAFVEVSRADLVAEYVGQTAPRTNAKIDEALDGVLFIDEAYALIQSGPEGHDSYGSEAVETLLKRMEDDRDRLVVIIAGYRDRLERFLDSNPGLRSRFGTMVEFDSYGPEELVAIAQRFAHQAGDAWGPGALERVRAAVTDVVARGWVDELGNGRFVRNLYEAACRARDLRLFSATAVAQGEPDTPALVTVEAADVDVALAELLEPLERRG